MSVLDKKTSKKQCGRAAKEQRSRTIKINVWTRKIRNDHRLFIGSNHWICGFSNETGLIKDSHKRV
jgi:hypothetical protein